VKSGSVRGQSCRPLFVVIFDHNSVTPVVTDRRAEIAYLGGWLRTHPQTKVVLEGHTDALGSEEYNLLLSYRRAKAVATALAEAGLPSDRLLIRGFGEQRPLTDRAATSVEQRRVSVRTSGSDECPKLH
jgi:outer membrane protein OmpA-like peptidoglycan-associated protein